MTSTKLLILGSGPAGLTAAIYAARAELAPVVIAGSEPGGQLTRTTMVENWPGAPEGVMGPQLVADMQRQAERFGAVVKVESAQKVDLSHPPFTVTTDNDTTYRASAVIIATGASPRYLKVPGERELLAHGVHTCATCDGFFYKGKTVAVVGGGDSALEEALFLSKFAREVTVIHRRDKLRASEIMVERAQKNPSIKWLWNAEITAFQGKERLERVATRDTVTGTAGELKVDGVFLAVGHIPNTAFLKEFITLDEHGFIDTARAPLTNIEGVFVAGDVNDGRYRQAITAAGAGCKAALEAQWWLKHGV